AFALLLHAGGRPRLWRVLAMGGLFALASLYKPIAVAPAALLALADIVAPWPGCSRRCALADALLIGGIGAAAWLATGACFAGRALRPTPSRALAARARYRDSPRRGAARPVAPTLLPALPPAARGRRGLGGSGPACSGRTAAPQMGAVGRCFGRGHPAARPAG